MPWNEDMTSSIHFESEIDRRAWFRLRVSEIGALLLRLPAARQQIAVDSLLNEVNNDVSESSNKAVLKSSIR